MRAILARRYGSVPGSKPFEKILIANRGEISCRVINTARKMGIATVAVYSEADRYAKHVRMADEAVCIGPAPSKQSYLVMERIIDACRKTGAQAVHPGYGFLSENPAFVEELEREKITFIGPPSTAIHAMGDKIESKKIAKKAGVHLIPGYLGEVHDAKELLNFAHEIGYPVMVKASAGGGGKGMRIAWNDKELLESFKLSKEEAAASFGDDRMLVEKYIDKGRHIEIQVLADNFDNVLYLNERECSIQRRNQKVVEEAPSPFLDSATRKAMGEQAVALARAVGYRSAGTVEFLVDADKNFYFLEMNTRLQVEHPITEMTTRQDIVRHMLCVAAGQPLPITQADIGIHGWAIESRVYAEDPMRNFLPSIGRLSRYVEPTSTDGSIRCDSGIVEGSNIDVHYDPMICKLVAWGEDREIARRKMATALDEYVIRGVGHNVSFLRAVMDNPRYISGDTTTKFIPTEYPKGFSGYPFDDSHRHKFVLTTAALYYERYRREFDTEQRLQSADPLDALSLVVSAFGQDYDVLVGRVEEEGGAVEVLGHHVAVSVNGGDAEEVAVEWDVEGGVARAALGGEEDVVVQPLEAGAMKWVVQFMGTKVPVAVMTKRVAELMQHMPKVEPVDHSAHVLSPMPGKIVDLMVAPGEQVVVGQALAVVEAMKMRNVIRSEVDAVVDEVKAAVGKDVQADDVLLTFRKK